MSLWRIALIGLAVCAAVFAGVRAMSGGLGPAPLPFIVEHLTPARGDAPIAILLHGQSGVGKLGAGYAREAASLAHAGVEVYLLNYYADAVASPSPNRAATPDPFPDPFRPWVRAVSKLVDRLPRGRRITLVGYSQGGYVALNVATQNRRVAGLVVEYSSLSLPDAERIYHHLPPTLIVHGEDDEVVPFENGKSYLELARHLGVAARLVSYSHEGHVFNLREDNPDARDALRRVTSFVLHGTLHE